MSVAQQVIDSNARDRFYARPYRVSVRAHPKRSARAPSGPPAVLAENGWPMFAVMLNPAAKTIPPDAQIGRAYRDLELPAAADRSLARSGRPHRLGSRSCPQALWRGRGARNVRGLLGSRGG